MKQERNTGLEIKLPLRYGSTLIKLPCIIADQEFTYTLVDARLIILFNLYLVIYNKLGN